MSRGRRDPETQAGRKSNQQVLSSFRPCGRALLSIVMGCLPSRADELMSGFNDNLPEVARGVRGRAQTPRCRCAATQQKRERETEEEEEGEGVSGSRVCLCVSSTSVTKVIRAPDQMAIITQPVRHAAATTYICVYVCVRACG